MSSVAIAVTGLGAIAPIGSAVEACWIALRDGVSAIRPWQNLPPGAVDTPLGAEVLGFDPAAHFEPRRLAALDRFAQFAVVAARQAVADAGLEFDPALRERSAVVFGTGIGAQATQEENYRRLFAQGASRVHPLVVPRAMPNAGASQIALELGIEGPVFAVASACASAAHAIAQGALLIRAGLADVALVGGSEACLTPGLIKGWESLRVLSRDTCRPFCAERSGVVLGEGAAALVLERADRARARGARPYALLCGIGMTAGGTDLVQPCVRGAERALRAALADGAVAPERVGYVNAHGTGTEAGDVAETRALRACFGAHADAFAVSSTKAVHGHLLGASGALEALATVLAVRRETLPPTAGFTRPGPGCDLDYVPNAPRLRALDVALTSSFGFGGLNAVLAFARAH